MFKKIISIFIVLIAVFAMLYFTGILNDLFKKDLKPMAGEEEVPEEKEMTQLKVGSKILGKSIEIKNIKITGNNPAKGKVLVSINKEGRGVWKNIDEILEKDNEGYSNKKLFYLLIIFFSAFLIIYALKSTSSGNSKKKNKEKGKNKKDKDDKLNFLDNQKE